MANFQRIAPLALVGLVAACGGDQNQSMDQETVQDPPSVEGTASPLDTMAHFMIELVSVDARGVTGEAMAMHSEEAVVVILELIGLTPGADHPAHIHVGSCASGGPVAAPLTSIAGLEDGSGTSTTSIGAAELSPSQAYFIQVHGPDGAPVACGDMEGHGSV